MTTRERYQLYNKLVLELEQENRLDHPAAVSITPVGEELTKVELEIQYASSILLPNVETEAELRAQLHQVIPTLEAKLIQGVKEWVG